MATPAGVVRLARAQGKVAGRLDSELEARFVQQLKAVHAPAWERNYRFHGERKWELDFAWPEDRFAVEIDGEVHRIKERFHKDITKHAAALIAGWMVLRVDGRAVRSGEALEWALKLLSCASGTPKIPPLTMPRPRGHDSQPSPIPESALSHIVGGAN